MIHQTDIGRQVIIRAADAFYEFVDGWTGLLTGFEAGCAVVSVPDQTVAGGFKVFLVPPDQVNLLRG